MNNGVKYMIYDTLSKIKIEEEEEKQGMKKNKLFLVG